MNNSIISKIEHKQITVGVIGLGYVGLPLLLCFVEKGFQAVGFDIDGKKIDSLSRCNSYIKHIPSQRIRRAVNSGLLNVTADFSSKYR